jgi:hypothetical protein
MSANEPLGEVRRLAPHADSVVVVDGAPQGSDTLVNGSCQLTQTPLGAAATFRAGVDVTASVGSSATGYIDNVVAWIKR